jgi:HD-like signal output (HDOD) protein
MMKAWLQRFIPAAQAPAALRIDPVGAARTEPDAPGRLHAGLLTDGQSSIDVGFLVWLLQSPAETEAPLGAREQQALQHLARLIADPGAHSHLLPRAAAVIPQLLARLRAASSSLSDLSQLVSRDVTLVAEVIGMANSPYYRRAQAVVELDHAIQVLGVDGMQNTIARVVLKPLIDARGGALVARSAKRLWEHTDRKAQLCAALARGNGFDPFDAYLLGLAHNAAWNAVLRTMDTVAGEQPWRLGAAFVAALGQRRDQLLAIIARQWQLPGPLEQVGADVGRSGLAADVSQQVLHLYAGDRLASLLCAHDRASASGLVDELLGAAGESARACFDAFAQPPAARAG